MLGLGFTMDPAMAADLISNDRRNAEVLFPYLNGQDVNGRPDSSASRWIVDFGQRSESEARAYPGPWSWILQTVKPERSRKDAKKYPTMVHEWWKYWRPRPELQQAVGRLNRVIVITLVSKAVMPMAVPNDQVFSHALGVFATDDPAMLALLSSAPHYWWAISRASTMKGDLRYTPSDVFETFARPELTIEMRRLGDRLDSFRRELMLSRQAGLTATYNLVHDSSCMDADIAELREIHGHIDAAVCRAYGWSDLVDTGLDRGFHETRQGVRYTVGPVVRQEILDRLLELNHERYAAEQVAGKPGKGRPKAARGTQGELFG